MKSAFFPRMPLSPREIYIKTPLNPGRRGALSLLPIFLIFLFLSLSLLMLTQIHLKLGGTRRHLALANLAAENGLKMGYLFLWEKAEESSWPLVLSSSDWPAFEAQLDEKFCLWLLSRLLNLDFPFFLESGWENMSWKTSFISGQAKIDFLTSHIQAKILIQLRAQGRMLSPAYSSYSQLLVETSLIAGYLPLTLFPLLVEKKMTPQEQSNYLQTKRIELSLDKKTLPAVKPYFSQEEIISKNILPFLEKGLKIRLLEPDRLNPLVLRKALGLEESREPVPEGVYLIKDDLGLGGVFVQGNLDKLVLTIEDGYQVISFVQGNKNWELRYHPPSSQTLWTTPEKSFAYDSLPNGILLINGNISSLEGKDYEEMAMSSEDLPASLLPGIKLCLVASGKIKINSSLFQSGLEVLPGIPYLQKKQSQLIIFSAGQDLISGEACDGLIIINPGQRKEMIIEANLTAGGNGVRIEGSGNKITIKGGLQTRDIENPGSILKIIAPSELYYFSKTEDPVPLTEKPLAALMSFKPVEWRDNERVYAD